MDANGEIIWRDGKHPLRKTFADAYQRDPHGSCWTDIPNVTSGRERAKWPTQKPLALYHRIIEASSNPGDLVLDPFCGCATTCIAAETAASGPRQWIGIDIDKEAENVTADRLHRECWFNMDADQVAKGITVRKSPPKRNPMNDDTMRLRLHQGGLCANRYCTAGKLRVEDLELDHRLPKSRGGADTIENRIGLCANCNRRKSTKSWAAFSAEEAARNARESVLAGIA